LYKKACQQLRSMKTLTMTASRTIFKLPVSFVPQTVLRLRPLNSGPPREPAVWHFWFVRTSDHKDRVTDCSLCLSSPAKNSQEPEVHMNKAVRTRLRLVVSIMLLTAAALALAAVKSTRTRIAKSTVGSQSSHSGAVTKIAKRRAATSPTCISTRMRNTTVASRN
jgi:hypothetical protein